MQASLRARPEQKGQGSLVNTLGLGQDNRRWKGVETSSPAGAEVQRRWPGGPWAGLSVGTSGRDRRGRRSKKSTDAARVAWSQWAAADPTLPAGPWPPAQAPSPAEL